MTLNPKKIWKELSALEIALIIINIGYLIYLNYSTDLIPNLNSGNETRIINGVQNPPNTILYSTNSFVPKSNVSNTQTFFGIVLLSILIFSFLSKKIGFGRATIEEAIEDIANQLISTKKIKDVQIATTKQGLKIETDFETIEIFTNFLTRYRHIMEVSEAFKYVINVEITDKHDGTREYYKAHYHPMTRYWDGLIKSERELSESDQCPKCGKEYDVRVIPSQELIDKRIAKKFTEVRR